MIHRPLLEHHLHFAKLLEYKFYLHQDEREEALADLKAIELKHNELKVDLLFSCSQCAGYDHNLMKSMTTIN